MEERLTTDQAVAGSSPATVDFCLQVPVEEMFPYSILYSSIPGNKIEISWGNSKQTTNETEV